MSRDTLSTRSVPFLTFCLLGQTVLAFVFQLVLAARFGSGTSMDALVAAWTVPMVLSGVLAGAIGFAFVPTHATVLGESVLGESVLGEPVVDESVASTEARLVGEVTLLVLLVTGLAAIAVTLFAEETVSLLVPGFGEVRSGEAEGLLRRLIWLVPLQSLAALLRAVQQGRGRFAITGVAAVVGSGTTLALTLLRADAGVEAVTTALLVGATSSCVVLGVGVVSSARLAIGLSPPVRGFVAMLGPLMLGSALQSSETFVDRHLASRLVEGSVARLGYATQLTAAILAIGVRGLSTVAFPSFARLAADGDDDGLRLSVATAARGVVFVFVPIVVGLAFFATPVVRLCFERRAFESADTLAVAGLLVGYLGLLVFGAAGDVLAKLLYAWRKAWFLVGIGLAGLVIGTAAKVLLVPSAGLAALAWCSSGVSALMAGVLVTIIVARLGTDAFGGLAAAAIRALLTTIPALVIAWLTIGIPVAGVPLAALLAGSTYLLVNIAIGDPFARQLLGRTPHRDLIDDKTSEPTK